MIKSSIIAFAVILSFFVTDSNGQDKFNSSALWKDTPSLTKSVRASGYPNYDYGDPTDDEQAHLEEINRARLNPETEAANFGIELNEGLSDGTISSSPVQPLTMNKYLLEAARKHCVDMLDKDYFDHYSQPGGESPFVRMTAEGYNYSYAGENIALKSFTYPVDTTEQIIDMHKLLFVDANYDGRGHRINMLISKYKEVGVGVALGEYYSDGISYAHSFMLDSDFGLSSESSDSFILGVVYEDKNNDGIYTSGEGGGNLLISVNEGYAETRTASAGGYGIPLPDGSYTIKAELPDGSFKEKNFTISGKNIKIDFHTGDDSSSNNENTSSGNDQENNNNSACFISNCIKQ